MMEDKVKTQDFLNFPIMPDSASSFAAEFDALFNTLNILTLVFTFIVGIMVLTLVIRYREGNTKVNRKNPQSHNFFLEAIWIVVPSFLGLAVFAWGAKLFLRMREVPENATNVYVIGKQWMWHIQHPNGIRENNELHVPVGRPVRLTMISQDVIHGFYIPQFRAQYHVVPGRYTTMWFTPTKAGKFNLFCSMHCGTGHSEMGGYVYALPPDEFEKWLEKGGNRFQKDSTSMVDAGEKLFIKNVCANCHTEGDSLRAPSLIGLVGKERKMSDGSLRIADDAYIRESIMNPYANILFGYENNIMPIYNKLSEEELLQLVSYVKSLSNIPEDSLKKGSQVEKTQMNKSLSNDGKPQ